MRLAIILFMIYYSMGTLLFPMGDLSYGPGLAAMYHECSHEDPDITPSDFVLEHLLNLGGLFSHIEFDSDAEHDKPHQLPAGHQLVQAFTIILNYLPELQSRKAVPTRSAQTFPLTRNNRLQSSYLSDIFRPPVA